MSSANAESSKTDSLTGVDRRARLQDTIASLITLRQEVLSSYCALTGINSFNNRDPDSFIPDADKLRGFCQVMVDYTAMGHFEVYQRIIEKKERRRAVREVAAEVYPAIAETTDFLVDFNDKYDDFESDKNFKLDTDELFRLGDIIAIRSELEDQILAALQR